VAWKKPLINKIGGQGRVFGIQFGSSTTIWGGKSGTLQRGIYGHEKTQKGTKKDG
jgi:hypothetical protein